MIAGERGAGTGLIADLVETTEAELASRQSFLIVTAVSRSSGVRIGRVPLTGPRFYAGLCEDSKCTKTLPKSPSGFEIQRIS